MDIELIYISIIIIEEKDHKDRDIIHETQRQKEIEETGFKVHKIQLKLDIVKKVIKDILIVKNRDK